MSSFVFLYIFYFLFIDLHIELRNYKNCQKKRKQFEVESAVSKDFVHFSFIQLRLDSRTELNQVIN